MIIKFFENRKWYFLISGSIMLLGLIFLLFFGVELDVQFKGGAILKYTYEGTIDTENIANITEKTIARIATAQETTDLATGEDRLVLTLAGNSGLEPTQMDALETALKAAYPDAKLALSESSIVEPYIGQYTMNRGLFGIALAAVLVVIYVWIRFKRISGLSAGVMALVALTHDLLVVFFTFVIFRIPLGDSFIAVALTILGYSINDTIVIYDRIRENSRIEAKLPVETMVNKSISQSLTRSIYTNIAVFISVALVYIFAVGYGIDSIKSFALPMAIGAVSGCYSTICIAGPLWVMWQKHKKNLHLKNANS